MDDPQEFKSLDELFRKTFDNLPDSPSVSGWDAPSPRVWEQVSTQLKPPKGGWSAQSTLLVSGLAIVLMLGMFWALTRPAAPAPPIDPKEQPAIIPAAPSPANSQSAPSTVATDIKFQPGSTAYPATYPSGAQPAPDKTPHTPAVPIPAASNTLSEENSELRRPAGSAPLPGTNPVSPNTTIRRQAEAWRSAPWAQPLAPLPGILQSQTIRPVPESLKLLYAPGKPE